MEIDDDLKKARIGYMEFDLKASLGDLMLDLIMSRRFLDHPMLDAAFSGICSALLITIRKMVEKGELTEEEVRAACANALPGDTPPDVRALLNQQIDRFMEMGNGTYS